ncbi:MAG: histidine kinase dimerization/phospho-acceptor domain-containing protein, partial [Hoeflea sp.]|nr:histidine kinase dimerization/phospho-acceptor domain-containing protein [Hoeflea sp.]
MVGIRQDVTTEAPAANGLAARVKAMARPLTVGSVIALAAVPAGLEPWQAMVGYGAFAAAMLAWPSGGETKKSRAKSQADKAAHFDFAVVEALDLPAIVFDQETLVIRQNSAARSLIGAYPDRATLSARIRSPAILDLVARVLERGVAESVEHAERVPSERWHEVRVARVTGHPDDAQRLYVMTFRDLTEARRMDRMRTDFVATASHELRTPLASLMGFIETMQGPAR